MYIFNFIPLDRGSGQRQWTASKKITLLFLSSHMDGLIYTYFCEFMKLFEPMFSHSISLVSINKHIHS